MANTGTLRTRLITNLAIKLGNSVPRKVAKLDAVLSCLPIRNNATKCLDVGTAHGGFSYHYTKIGTWTFLEADKDRLKIARTMLDGRFVIETDLASHLKGNQGYDLITLIDVAVYFSNLKEILLQCYEALSHGGYLILSGGNESLAQNDALYKFRDSSGIEKAVGRTTNLNYLEMQSLLKETGFKIDKVVLYYGVCSGLIQTFIDLLILRPNTTTDRLYESFSGNTLSLAGKWLLTFPLKSTAWIANLFDKWIFPKRRYAYVIRATRLPQIISLLLISPLPFG